MNRKNLVIFKLIKNMESGCCLTKFAHMSKRQIVQQNDKFDKYMWLKNELSEKRLKYYVLI